MENGNKRNANKLKRDYAFTFSCLVSLLWVLNSHSFYETRDCAVKTRVGIKMRRNNFNEILNFNSKVFFVLTKRSQKCKMI